MKKLLLVIALIAFQTLAHSQSQFIKGWTLWCEYQQNNMQQTSDNGYIMCTDAVPEMDSVNHLAWCYLIKLDPNGAMQWMKKFAKSSYFVKANDGNAVVQTSDGGYAIGTVMYTSSPTTFNSHTAIYVVKVDGSGNLLWSGTYPGIGNSSAYCIQETSDHGLIVSGNTVDTMTTSQYNYILRLDSVGTFLWGKTYAHQNSGYAFYSISQTFDGGFIACGTDGLSSMITKLDQNGNVTWSDMSTAVGQTSENDIIELANGSGYLSCGSHYNEPGLATMTRFDLQGNALWSYTYPHPVSSASTSGADYDEAYSIVQSADGYTLSLAEVGGPSEARLLHTDTTGMPVWFRNYSYTSYFLPIDLEYCNDGGYAFCSGYFDNFGNWDVSLTKTDANGITTCGDSLILDSVANATLPAAVTLQVTSVGQRLPVTTVIFNENVYSKDYCGKNWEGIVDHPGDNGFLLYPNPADGEMNIRLPDELSGTLQCHIVNALGQEVYEKDVEACGNDCRITIPLDAFANGIYLVRIGAGSSEVYTNRFVISH